MQRLARVYLLLSAALVGLLYLLWAGRGADPGALAVEAVFAWLVVFVPPLALLERSLALVRALLRLSHSLRVAQRPPRGH